MPRSQPAVRATALGCLLLRRNYVSSSASPAAHWGLKVILQSLYQQRTSLAATVPLTHRIVCRKSHREGTFNVLAPCLRGTFNVRSPCHRPRVRTAVCVSVPQWHGAAPPTCVASTVWAASKCKFNASRSVSEEINQDFFIGWTKRVGQLRWLPCGAISPWLRVLITNHVPLLSPVTLVAGRNTSCCCRTLGCILSAEAGGPTASLRAFFGALTLRFGSHLFAELTITLGIISLKK